MQNQTLKLHRMMHVLYKIKYDKKTQTFFNEWFFFCHLQYLQVQIDSQGNLVQIVNRNKSITIPFSSQGFYWYEGMSITKMKKFFFFSYCILFQFKAILIMVLVTTIKHQVLMCFDHTHKLHNQ